THARLKNLVFSYTIPQNLLTTWNLGDLKLYVTGDNLLTFYGHQGLDPEQTVSGTTGYRYPAQKSYSLGINLSFSKFTIMKYLHIYILIIVFLLTSCDDSFFETYPATQVTTEEVFSSEDNIDAFINGALRYLMENSTSQ